MWNRGANPIWLWGLFGASMSCRHREITTGSPPPHLVARGESSRRTARPTSDIDERKGGGRPKTRPVYR